MTVALDAIGIGLLIPILPKLIEELSHGGLAQAAVYGGWLTALFAAVQFFAAPVLGNLSDRFGRRPVLLTSLSAFGLSYLLMASAPTLGWLFCAQALAGMFSATPSTAGAYISDVATPEDRVRHFGYLGAAFGLGIIVGPTVSGLLAGFGTRVPFLAASGLAILNFCYGLLVLPESLPPERRRAFSWERAHPLGALRSLRRYSMVTGLLGSLLLLQIALQTIPATWPYFTMESFGWTTRDVGYSLGLYGIASIVVQGGLIKRINGWLGGRFTACLGISCLIVSYLGLALATKSWMAVVSIPLTVMGFMTGPSLVSAMSAVVRADGQGELQGVIASVNSLAAILTPLIMPRIFSAFSAHDAPVYFPGAPYLAGVLLAAAAMRVVLRSMPSAVRVPGESRSS